MTTERYYNVLEGFDFTLLDDPEFQEDSVREEIIAPILKGLGYGPGKPHRIIRSKKLKHPFVSIGSARKRIELIPDYLLEVDDRFAWVLEAKSPQEDINKTKHLEQAYSYAIHSEIRVPYFALCNGRAFVLYHVSRPKPVLQCDVRALPAYWESLGERVRPEVVLGDEPRLRKDFGLHLKRLGFHEFESLVFPNVPIPSVTRLNQGHFMFSAALRSEGEDYLATFDFNTEGLQQLRGNIPEAGIHILEQPLAGQLPQVTFANAVYRVIVDCRVSDRLEETKSEIFLPLWVNRFLTA